MPGVYRGVFEGGRPDGGGVQSALTADGGGDLSAQGQGEEDAGVEGGSGLRGQGGGSALTVEDGGGDTGGDKAV